MTLPPTLTRAIVVSLTTLALTLVQGPSAQAAANPDSARSSSHAQQRAMTNPCPGNLEARQQDYTYDNLGRLTRTQDTRSGACTTRTYGFSAASERSSSASYGSSADGTCQQTTAAISKTNTYDSANRIRNSGYVYDTLGRMSTTPMADTAAGGVSDLTASFYANDMVKSLTQTVDNGTGGSSVKNSIYLADPTGRINTVVNKTAGTETNRFRYRFGGGSDSPASIQTSNDGGSGWVTTTRYITIPSVGMVASVADNATTIQIANLHGDVVATQALQTSALTLDSYAETDEYGNVPAGVGAGRYAYLGTAQRSADAVGGVILMGARVYNPVNGQFASPDPVLGGNATPYAYPNDPINSWDPQGDLGYTMSFHIGWYNSARRVFDNFLNFFGRLFPIPGHSMSRPYVGQRMNLRPYGMYFPIKVTSITATSMTFKALAGHPDWPGGTIEFRVSGANRYTDYATDLVVTARVPIGSPGSLCFTNNLCFLTYLTVARVMWGELADNMLEMDLGQLYA